MSPAFKIGDVVWTARAGPAEKWIQCPHCFGKRFLTVILGDDSRVQIDCAGCQIGYDPPRGEIRSYDYTASVEARTITGIDCRTNDGVVEVMYWFGCGGFNGENTFATKSEAEERANVLVGEHDREEQHRLQHCKTKQDRTWAWNATYHRSELKRALHDVEYHKSKISVCQSHDAERLKEVKRRAT